MRQAFCNGLVQQALLPEFVFLTGDLGFKALEPLQDAMGSRFINAGVSEQKMVSVAAGLARSGLRQIGVDYVRPERMFGRTTNSLLKNLGWAKKGILSFSYVPLDIMSTSAIALCAISLLMIQGQLLAKLLFPQLAPKGFATLIILIVFFGSLNVLAISVAGEYIAKIFEEVKQRPHYIRRSIIRDGEVRPAAKEK